MLTAHELSSVFKHRATAERGRLGALQRLMRSANPSDPNDEAERIAAWNLFTTATTIMYQAEELISETVRSIKDGEHAAYAPLVS
jgi:hypothetical protein